MPTPLPMSHNSEKFTGLAQIYARHRPGYPDKAISFILEKCELEENSPVADIGAGTGILARALSEAGLKDIIGIEPNLDMRSLAKNINTTPGTITYKAGTAEETGLPDDSKDAILSAQAFHWFEPEKSLVEFHRILKKNGHCVLLWNVRDETDSFTREYGEIMFDHSTNTSDEVKRGVSGKKLLMSPLFQSVAVMEFQNNQKLDREGLFGRAFSTSYAPREGKLKASLEESLEALFKTHATTGRVNLKYITSVYIASKIEPA